MNRKFLLYGANGYTGRLILKYYQSYDLQPVLAGRSEEKVRPLAETYGLDYRIADLNDTAQLDAALAEIPVVLHAAGPFIDTARPMIEACLRTGTHYLDITGEIPVFEMAAAYGPRASKAGIMVLPGAGFDVVPTDCLALFLKNRLPDATHLQLAFAGLNSGTSHGTALTMVNMLGEPSAVRRKGEIVPVPLGHKSMWVPFPERELFTMTIPWGDVATAYYSTGIPNIETYTGVPPRAYRFVRLLKYFGWLLRSSPVRRLIKSRIDRGPAGPTDEERAKGKSQVWGRVINGKGESASARLSGPEGYTLTAHSSLLITEKVLKGEAPAGFQTPAKAYGPDLVLEVPEVERWEMENGKFEI